MIKVILADPQRLFRAAMKYLLAASNSVELIAEVSNGKDTLHLLNEKHIDIVLLSSAITDTSVITLIKRILRDNPKIKILVLANELNAVLARKFLAVGAKGFVAKTVSEDYFIDTLKKVSLDKIVLPIEIAQDLAEEQVDDEAKSPFSKLSNREMDILLLMVKGKSIKQISEMLHLSPKTISTYKGRIYEKLKISTSMELFLLANKYGLISMENLHS